MTAGPVFRPILYAACLIGLIGCATPSERFADRARAYGFKRHTVVGETFTHETFANRRIGEDHTLHVYLGGDGTPWIDGRPAADPTQHVPLALALMAVESGPALYLGRPCYHGKRHSAGCHGWLWTDGRYNDAVVTSMAAALDRIVARYRYARVVLIGHSGGGALAMLLAPRSRGVVAVVTIAANLDIDAWSDLHGYGRLTGSLNPARQPPLAKPLIQMHFAGGRDRVVPPKIVKAGLRDGLRLTVIPQYDHLCCWTAFWPQVLAQLSKLTVAPGAVR